MAFLWSPELWGWFVWVVLCVRKQRVEYSALDLCHHTKSSTTYTRDAIYMATETTGNRECLSYGYMSTGVAYGGLFYFRSGTGLGNMSWYIATIYMNSNTIGTRGLFIYPIFHNMETYGGLNTCRALNISTTDYEFATVMLFVCTVILLVFKNGSLMAT